MTVAVPPVLSQRTYPGVGDIDDCWVVSTVWAASCSRPAIRKPSATLFRHYAGDPDDGHQDGGSIDECYAGAKGSWPGLDRVKWDSSSWTATQALLHAGRPASCAVDSGKLPLRLRFGFTKKHQVGIVFANGRLWCANPLAADGSEPLPITWDELRIAMAALLTPPYATRYRAILFPVPLEGECSVRFSPRAKVRIYTVSPRPGVDCIRQGWHDERWGFLPSSARGELPVRRRTCDGRSGARTVLIVNGHYAGQYIWADAPGIKVTLDA